MAGCSRCNSSTTCHGPSFCSASLTFRYECVSCAFNLTVRDCICPANTFFSSQDALCQPCPTTPALNATTCNSCLSL